ncbi:MAG: translation initiation factor [Ignavibacteriae bacterium]|nr:translation initiation factor [Ignavibacteriota bacterium]
MKTVKQQLRLNSFSDLKKLLPSTSKDYSPDIFLQKSHKHDGKGKAVRVFIDKSGRRGKTVTVVSGFQHNPQTIEEIAKILKQYCGAGGTVKEREIEIQGEQGDRVSEKLRELNYIVK